MSDVSLSARIFARMSVSVSASWNTSLYRATLPNNSRRSCKEET